MEQVTHPTHYNLEGRKECWDEMEEKFGVEEAVTFCIMSAYKYIYRAGEKDSFVKDIRKAETFLRHAYERTNKCNSIRDARKALNYKYISKMFLLLAEKRAEYGQNDNLK